MNEISAYRVAQAVSAMKAIDEAWNANPNGAMRSSLITDLAIARIDFESTLLLLKLTVEEV
ncbi:hypothetical protein SAMN05216466_107142 [Paraburkholderia phenazinium]|uniref:Uncharacterized protein n=1 Tax=Paraburkholderia phenazinium TaxID=60549 RepID=A0A1G7ZSW5_9BURK|nr:hypothetical protein [Paraburkholderia phenazinium]SDH11220.1 hypothetical protein SAMN05216466_107142 [Paraburkholderia phenazinium]